MNAGEMSSKPLFVAKFNKENVQYKEALKRAVNSARNKKPNVMFEVVAVSPANGKATFKRQRQKTMRPKSFRIWSTWA